jgi:hypothetical protein
VVGSILQVPVLKKPAGTDGEPITAVGVSDFQDRTRDRLTFRYGKLPRSVTILSDREKRHPTVLHRQLDRESSANLAVVLMEKAQL